MKEDMTTNNKETDSNIIDYNGEYYIKCWAHEEIVKRNLNKQITQLQREVKELRVDIYQASKRRSMLGLGRTAKLKHNNRESGNNEAVDKVLALLDKYKS